MHFLCSKNIQDIYIAHSCLVNVAPVGCNICTRLIFSALYPPGEQYSIISNYNKAIRWKSNLMKDNETVSLIISSCINLN